MDDVIYDPLVLKSAVIALHTCKVLFVGVRCPVDIAEQRERDRGDRWPGLVTAHIDLVHAHGIYDLDVDTSVLTAMECAEKIKERLLNGSPPNAFQHLHTVMAVAEN
jgi:chloramphenicol 3-O phosphotransferase